MAFGSTDPSRGQELKKLHVAKRELGFDDDLWRTLVARISGMHRKMPVTSSGLMDRRERQALIEELKRMGFVERPARAQNDKRPMPDDTMVQKMVAMWIDLHKLGAVRNSSDKSLRAYVKRMTKKPIEWLTVKQMSMVIESLKKWLERVEDAEAKGDEKAEAE